VRAPYQNTMDNKTAKRVLVLDANQRSALAVTRALGKRPDLMVFTADSTPRALAGCSRYSSLYSRAPSPETQPREFLNWLRQTIVDNHVDWVFPITEISSQLILSETDVLGSAQIPFASLDTVMSLADKWNLVQLAQSAGIPHPNSQHFNNAVEVLDGELSQFSYPLVLKPCQSRRWLGDRWLNTSVHIAHSEIEFRQLLQDKNYFRDYPFMIQQFIAGHGAGVFALYSNAKPITFFAHQRLREKPPQGGVSVLSESVALPPLALDYARKLLDAAQWHGVAMVEFRVASDGTPYLMEVNTRFWGSLQLAIDSGVDFPSLLYKVCCGEAVEPVSTYKTGRRLRWLLGDLDSLYLTLRHRETFSIGDKLKRLLAFVIPRPDCTRHEVNRWDDMGPAWHELKAYISNFKK
jgi:predicted ATP-grasp superfamily ATP-dependent carboligase